MTSQVVGADYTDATLLPNFVNGRLLVAEDLATEQATLRTRDTRIGEAAGTGVVRGLWVTGSATAVTIAPGLALAPAGAPVVVSRTVTLQLSFTTAAPPTSAGFSCCDGPGPGQTTSLTTGVYLLAARPACRLEGEAPMAPAPGATLSPCCVAQWRTEGVEFRVVSLPVVQSVADIPVTAGNRRNLLAHWCFGTEAVAGLGQDPFRFSGTYGLDDVDPQDLTPYDVALAVFRWDAGTVTELDNWSVRREVTAASPVPSSWSATTGDRRVSEGKARFLQFQDQAEELVSRSLAASATAPTYFGLLPPVGFLPVTNTDLRALAVSRIEALTQAHQQAVLNRPAADVQAEVRAEWANRLPEAATVAEGRAAVGAEAGPTTTAQLTAIAADHTYFQQLVDVADTSVGYGFNPQLFFRGFGRFGGVLTWDLAEWALQQSWRAQPVSTAPAAALDNARLSILGSKLTYYYVLENIEAAQRNLLLRRGQALTRALEVRVGFVRANLYVVYIANQRWVTDTVAPFVDYRFGGDLKDPQ